MASRAGPKGEINIIQFTDQHLIPTLIEGIGYTDIDYAKDTKC